MTDTPSEMKPENTGDVAPQNTGHHQQEAAAQAKGTAHPADNGTQPADAAAEQVTEKPPLEAQLAEAQTKAAEYLDGWQRARAEFVNFRKRAEKELDEAYQNAAVEMLKKLLPVIDDFERALASIPAEMVDNEVIKGFTLIYRKLLSLLENAGLKAIDPQGEPFDPAFHEAVGQDDTGEVPSGHVSGVLQKGYLHGERVVRPALVRVAV